MSGWQIVWFGMAYLLAGAWAVVRWEDRQLFEQVARHFTEKRER